MEISGSCRTTVRIAEMSALAGLQNPDPRTGPLRGMFHIECSGPLVPGLLPGPHGGDPVATGERLRGSEVNGLSSSSGHLSYTKRPFMPSLNQIQRELKAILDFDILYLAASRHYPEEIVGFKFRQLRKQELLGFAELLASRN